MKTGFLMLFIAAGTAAACAQSATTPPTSAAQSTTSAAKPASSAAKPATSAAKPAGSATKTAATAAKPAAAAAHAGAPSTGFKIPPGIPPVKGIVQTPFAERWEDIKIGTGADAEPNKVYKVNYTGYLGANGRDDDGKKFDSSYDHPGQPLKDKDGKPVLGEDGKPKLGDPQPISFPQGFGRLIPGFDQGFEGMKVGGKRRIFIPWQLAYGDKGRPGPDPAHPVIPPKANLIFDVELVDISDMPAQANRPMQVRPGGAAPPKGGAAGTPAPGASSPAPGSAAKPATPPAAGAPATSAAPATPASSAAPSTTAPAQPQSK